MKKIHNLSLIIFFLLLFCGCSKSKPEILKSEGHTFSKVKYLLSLAENKEEAQKHLSLVIKATYDKYPSVRRHAAFVMEKIGTDAYSGVPALITLLSDSDENVQKSAIMALGGIGPKAGESVTALMGLLGNKQTDLLVIRTLREIGAPAIQAVPYLEKRLIENRDNIDIEGYIKEALSSITGKEYAIVEYPDSSQKYLRIENKDGTSEQIPIEMNPGHSAEDIE